MKWNIPVLTLVSLAVISGFLGFLARKNIENKILGTGYLSSLKRSYFEVETTSTAAVVITTSSIIVNNSPTTTFALGRFFVDESGNVFASGTMRASGVFTADSGCVNCGGVGESWVLVNSHLTPSSSAQGIMVSPSSSFGGLVSISGGVLSLASSTFTSGLNVGRVLNASSTLLAQTLVGYASSSFQDDLTVSGDLLASSTLQVSGLPRFYTGYIANASSSVGGAFTISNLISCNTIDTNALGLLACGTDAIGDFNAADDDWTVLNNSGLILTTTTFSVLIGNNATSSRFALEVQGDAVVYRRTEVNYLSATSTATSSAFYGGLLGLASSTFQLGLNVNGALNASSTALVQTLVGYASSSFQNDLTVSGDLLVSSTLQATGLATLYGGFISNVSSTVSADLNVAGDLLATSTLQATGLATLYGGFISVVSSTVSADLNIAGDLLASSTLQATGLATLYSGFISLTSSTVSADLNVAGDLLATSTLQATGLATLYGGLISTASSSFAGAVTVGNLMSSGTIALADGYQMATALKDTGLTISAVTTTDMITIKSFRRAVTIRSLEAILDCATGCTGATAGAGIRFNLRHGTSRAASTTASTLFDNDILVYGTTTLQSFCPTGTYSTACTFTPTMNDVTLAANEVLWLDASSTAGSASTTEMNLSFTVYFDEP